MEETKQTHISGRRVAICTVLAVLTAFAFFMNHSDITLDLSAYSGISRSLYSIYQKLAYTVNGYETELSLGCVGFFAFYWYLSGKKWFLEKVRFSWLFSLFFGLIYLAGLYFLDDVTITTSGVQILKSCIVLAGITVFYEALIRLLRHALTLDFTLRPGGRLESLSQKFLAHPFRNTFVILLICWVIPLLLKYPAGLCYDVRFQIDQGLGNVELTSHHPILHTMLMTWFVKFGLWLGSANVGIFLFVTLEAVVFALAAAYGMSVLVRLKTAKWTRLVYLLFFAFCPFVTGYVGAAIKDVYFSIFSLLFTIVFAESLLCEDFWATWKKPVLFILAATGLVLFRNNGVYVLLGTVVISVLFDHKKSKWRKRRFAVLFLACLIPIAANNALETVYQVEEGSIVEALSLPLQQTARMVKYHSDEITEEEEEIISKVLDYDSLADAYDPYLSDAVKRLYQDPTTEELMDYFQVWFKQFFREPLCYIAATLEQNVMLGYPGYTNYTYYIGSYDDGYPNTYGILFTTPTWLEGLQDAYSAFLNLLHRAPVLYWINNMSTYTILLCAVFVLFLNRRDSRNILYLVPAFIAVAVVICAPGIILNVRYMLPVIYVVPFYLGCYTSPFSRFTREETGSLPESAPEAVSAEKPEAEIEPAAEDLSKKECHVSSDCSTDSLLQ